MRKIVIPIIITSAIIPMIIIPIVEEVPKLITSNKHDYDSIQQLYMQLAKFTTVISREVTWVYLQDN